ncbi:ABATE domain-containing protein [Glycomyces sp. TRM65418]|uniref:CGNR zinc finger domain-containing protein n=1 Tax=Glycomyces sp. TRM65418 TaxID=2867006 RepID=UPI001CE5C900|nr:ABATE domain-containing protein [Glycomyces sp. TRM65418]MCC3765076.1 ABATE domain-containing protein [Glycomyces sp. TRM65418]QZD54705.1 ABATE domain-containing protein [Glycomyces sp. TRM65418]
MNTPSPLVGEPLAIDLVNTLTGEGDLLATPEQLGTWLALETPRYPAFAGHRSGRPALAAALAVREHAAAAFSALLEGRRPPEAALRGLAAAVNAAPGRVRLAWEGTAVTATVERDGTAAERLAADLAQAAVDVLISPDVAKLKRCGADDCVLIFLAAHPRRQWCSAERCGNRVRVARHYRRRKADRAKD